MKFDSNAHAFQKIGELSQVSDCSLNKSLDQAECMVQSRLKVKSLIKPTAWPKVESRLCEHTSINSPD